MGKVEKQQLPVRLPESFKKQLEKINLAFCRAFLPPVLQVQPAEGLPIMFCGENNNNYRGHDGYQQRNPSSFGYSRIIKPVFISTETPVFGFDSRPSFCLLCGLRCGSGFSEDRPTSWV
jgi:hypothetical protein